MSKSRFRVDEQLHGMVIATAPHGGTVVRAEELETFSDCALMGVVVKAR